MSENNDMAPPNPQQKEIEIYSNNIYYNCTECSSLIEILAINEKDYTIHFKCTNENHNEEKIMGIKEYLEKMEKYKINKINERCEKHNNNEYMFFCLNCKCHLCIECAKTRNH